MFTSAVAVGSRILLRDDGTDRWIQGTVIGTFDENGQQQRREYNTAIEHEDGVMKLLVREQYPEPDGQIVNWLCHRMWCSPNFEEDDEPTVVLIGEPWTAPPRERRNAPIAGKYGASVARIRIHRKR